MEGGGFMKKKIKNLTFLLIVIVACMHIANKIISFLSGIRDDLPIENGQYYSWRYGNVYYTKKGKGSPLLLIHDMQPWSSSWEWHRIIRKLAESHTVYALDLLGCGRSEKPNLTYTNYMYVQLVNDFIRNVIGNRTDILTSGASVSFCIMACQMEEENFGRLIAVNPPDLYGMAQMPDHGSRIKKYIMDLPIIGTMIYNMAVSRIQIRKMLLDKGYCKSHLVPNQAVNTFYSGAHLMESQGKYLLASMVGKYTNINIAVALQKVNHSISLIGGKELEHVSEIMNDYVSLNVSIETAYIANTKYFPHLEAPDKFAELVTILIG